jgi:hypothetical protein
MVPWLIRFLVLWSSISVSSQEASVPVSWQVLWHGGPNSTLSNSLAAAAIPGTSLPDRARVLQDAVTAAPHPVRVHMELARLHCGRRRSVVATGARASASSLAAALETFAREELLEELEEWCLSNYSVALKLSLRVADVHNGHPIHVSPSGACSVMLLAQCCSVTCLALQASAASPA